MKKVTLKRSITAGKKLAVWMWIVMCLVCSTSTLTVQADNSKEVTEARNGVLRVDLLYEDKDGNEFLLGSGSGFLINSNTVLTCAHVVDLSDEDKDKAQEVIGGDFKKSFNNRMKLRVAVMRDVYVSATVKVASDELDFAILLLSEPIAGRMSLKLAADSDIDSTAQVYALGFPGSIEPYQNVNSYTYGDVTVTDGKVTKLTTINDVDMIQHSATISDGNSGGPLVTEDGCVVGINNASVDDTYFYAIGIDQVISLLDTIEGMEYTTSDGAAGNTEEDSDMEEEGDAEEPEEVESEEPQAEPEPVAAADKTALSSAISEAKAKDVNGYTEESVADFNEALSSAETIHNSAEATQVEVDGAVSKLQAASGALVEQESGMNMMVIAIGAGVAVVVVIIIVVVVVSGKKKDNSPTPMTPPGPRPGTMEGNSPVPHGFTPPGDSGAGETTVLISGAGETTVLGGGGGRSTAKLVRLKTGENINLNRSEFTIGKDRTKVSYCISGDSSISRVHAKISVSGGEYMVSDMRSTNGTFVNGMKIEPGRPVALKVGDKVMFSEEEFEFRM